MISHLEWIKPGAEIVVYQSRDGQASDPVKTTVKTRAKKSFTVEGVEDPVQPRPDGDDPSWWWRVVLGDKMGCVVPRQRVRAHAVRAGPETAGRVPCPGRGQDVAEEPQP